MITRDELRKADKLRSVYGNAWEICTDVPDVLYAWRHENLAKLDGHLVNVLRAGDIDELANKLAEQEAPQ
ncbi:hypothetical protein ACTWPT_51920 [Nonomuraea sp. 3N208]|uniref:hypothetical protein n=1 Tax=Nonomuraea sp. 3N208 TaxID=3457421 RepID=UPI003FCFDA25